MSVVSDLQAQVGWEVGAALPGGPALEPVSTQLRAAVQAQVPALWNAAVVMPGAAAPNSAGTYLRYLYTLRGALKYVLGNYADFTDAMLGRVFRQSASQRFRNAKQLLDSVEKQITATLPLARAGRAAVIAPILVRAPVDPGGLVHVPAAGEPVNPSEPGFGSPNFRGYSGSPFATEDTDYLTGEGGY